MAHDRMKHPVRFFPFVWGLAALFSAAVPVMSQPAGVPELPPTTSIRIQGKPAFPVGLYHYPRHEPGTDRFASMTAAGIDFFLMPSSTPKEDLDAAHARGIRVMITAHDLLNLSGPPEAVERKKKALAERIGPGSVAFQHPAVVALEGPDEPLWNIKYGAQAKRLPPEMATWARPADMREEIHALLRGLRDGYAEVRRLCGDRYAVWLNFAPRGDEDELRWFTGLPVAGGFPQDGRTTADVFGTDIYPVPDGGGNNGWIRGRHVPSAAAVGAFTEKLRRAVHPHPFYMVLHSCGIEEWDPKAVEAGRDQRRPTFEEQQFMVWDAIVNGAGGILYWGAAYIHDGDLYWQQIGRVNRGVRALAPVLAEGAPWPDARPGMPQVRALGKIHGDAHYVITTNNSPHVTPGWVAVPGWKGPLAYSLLDGREVPVKEEILRDDLPAFGVGVYSDSPERFAAFGRPSPAAAPRRPARLLFGLPLDLDPFKGKSPAEVAALLKAAGVDGVVKMPHDPALVDALHAQGIRAHAEISCFGGRGAWKTHPKTRPVMASGEPYPEDAGYGGLCLSQEDYVRDLLARIDSLLGEAAWDGLWLDYIRWPGKWEEKDAKTVPLCFCETCLDRFATDRGVAYPKEMTSGKDRAAWILQHHGASWTAWKCDRVVDVVSRIRERLKAARGPDAILGIFSVPLREGEFDGALRSVYGQDWAKLGPVVDVFSPMAYHGFLGRPVEWIAEACGEVAAKSRKAVWPIVQGGADPGGVPVADFERALRAALTDPCSGAMVFTTGHAVREGRWGALTKVYGETAAGGKTKD
jgi:hypothetical protein